jgi:hypothetical protein
MQPMMEDSMMNGMMTICMIASALFAVVILFALVIQAVVQVKLLREVRKLHLAKRD